MLRCAPRDSDRLAAFASCISELAGCVSRLLLRISEIATSSGVLVMGEVFVSIVSTVKAPKSRHNAILQRPTLRQKIDPLDRPIAVFGPAA